MAYLLVHKVSLFVFVLSSTKSKRFGKFKKKKEEEVIFEVLFTLTENIKSQEIREKYIHIIYINFPHYDL